MTPARSEATLTLYPDRLALPVAGSVKDRLVGAFSNILEHAQNAAHDADTDAVTAVHEYRKALRRARSLLRMLRRLVDDAVYRELSDDLRRLHRATSDHRDRDVVMNTFHDLDLTQAAPSVATDLHDAIAQAEDSGADVAGVLRQGVAELTPMPRALAAGLPARVTWRDLTNGLERTYRRTRRDMYRTFLHGGGDDLHRWRKRNKELTYQVELLTTRSLDRRSRKLRKRLARMSKILGKIVDLGVLADYVSEHASEQERGRVLAAIDARKRVVLDKALRHGSRLLEDRPKKFARRVVKSARATHRLAKRATQGQGRRHPS